MPSLELPPAPFTRSAKPTTTPEPLPSGATIEHLLESLRIEPSPSSSEPTSPHAGFHAAVERRARRERRREPRSTPERRHFASSHLAAPDTGPLDPRPVDPPSPARSALPMPLDTRMPELPSEPAPLAPALPYQLPSRGVAAETIRSTRPSFGGRHELPTAPAAPASAPAAPPEGLTLAAAGVAPAAPTARPIAPPAAALAPAAAAAAAPAPRLDAIFEPQREDAPMGRLEPWGAPSHAQLPDAGPAGPSIAPGAGLHRVVATAAAVPGAWFGGHVEVDDAMLVWNAPAAHVPLAPSVAAAISPAEGSPSVGAGAAAAAAAPTGIATTALAPAPTAAPAGTGSGAGGATRLLRLLGWVGLPAGGGIGAAVAVDRLLL